MATAQAQLAGDLSTIDGARRTTVLNLEKPAVDDALGLVLEMARTKSLGAVEFTPEGEHGFAETARVLAQRTLTLMAEAVRHYRW